MKPVTQPFECHLPVKTQQKVAIELLAENCALSKQQLKLCFAQGAVWLQKGKNKQRLRRVKKVLQLGESLHLYYDADIVGRPVPKAQLINDLQHYSVWQKPAGLLSQGSLWGDHCSLLRVVEQFFLPARQALLVHRLDREAFGLMIVAHHAKAAALLSQSFQQRSIIKRYNIRVHGRLEPTDQRIDSLLDGKASVSLFSLKHYDEETQTSGVEVRLETGRKHQIRRHCQSIGHPVVGDRQYGHADGQHLQLQAAYLAFDCPVTKQHQVFELPNNIDKNYAEVSEEG